MSEEVCKVYILRRFREAGYALTMEERAAKLAQVAAARQECGGRLLLSAIARWSGYGVYGFGAEVFPDVASLQKHTAALEELNWYRFVESESFIGTPLIFDDPVYENPIYQLQLIRGPREASYAMPKERLDGEFKRVFASVDEQGMRRVLRLDCRWSREDLRLVQLHEWPNLKAQMKHTAFEEQQEWPRLFNQTHILGIKAA